MEFNKQSTSVRSSASEAIIDQGLRANMLKVYNYMPSPVKLTAFDALAYLGRPLEYVEVERQATLYFLRIHESHHGKLTHIKEKRCIGIAPLL